MSWKDVCVMSQRVEFVSLASAEGANVSELCRRFGVSRKTGDKWLSRSAAQGRAGLLDQSRRPKVSAGQIDGAAEERVLALRREHPAWGGRKLRRRLLDLQSPDVPAASTITSILRRQGLLDVRSGAGQPNVQRFEHAAPNDLWQRDFKGHFALTRGGRCHPLTVLDDHSRYSIGLRACDNERTETVETELIAMFRRCVPPLWSATADADGQWLAVGRRGRSTLDPFDRVVGTFGNLDPPRPAVSSADTGEG